MAKPKNLKVGTRVVPKFGPFGPGKIIALPEPANRHYYVVDHDNGMQDSSDWPGANWDAENLRLER